MWGMDPPERDDVGDLGTIFGNFFVKFDSTVVFILQRNPIVNPEDLTGELYGKTVCGGGGANIRPVVTKFGVSIWSPADEHL